MNGEEPLVDDKADAKSKGKRGRGALSSDAMKRARLMNQSRLSGGKNQKVSKMLMGGSKSQAIGPGLGGSRKKKKQSLAQADLG